MKIIRYAFSTVFVSAVLFSAGVAIANGPTNVNVPQSVNKVVFVVDHQVDDAVIAAENATEVYLPASYGHVHTRTCSLDHMRTIFP